MRGRILSIKKTTILRLSFILNLLLFLTASVLTIFFYKIENFWFFAFCFFMGMFLITKSFLFKLDSACYFGAILLLIGFFYPFCQYFGILHFQSLFVLLSFAFASFATGVLFHQPFQIAICLSLIFATITTLLYLLNLISIPFFVAFIIVNVLLLICSYFIK